MSSLSRPRSDREHPDTKILGNIIYIGTEVLILTFLGFSVYNHIFQVLKLSIVLAAKLQ